MNDPHETPAAPGDVALAFDPLDPQSAPAMALASELYVVVSHLKRRMRDHVQVGELSWTQIRVLARIDRAGPSTVSALAREERMRSQSMGEIVNTLKTAGYVTGAPDPNDGRQTVLSLTPTAVQALQTGRQALHEWLYRGIRAQLGDAEQAQLTQAVALLKRLVEA